jgi:hypothetical protein
MLVAAANHFSELSTGFVFWYLDCKVHAAKPNATTGQFLHFG